MWWSKRARLLISKQHPPSEEVKPCHNFLRSSQKVTQRRAFTIHWELSQTTGEAALVSLTAEIAVQLSGEPNIWLDKIFKGGKKSHKKGSHYSLGALPDYWGGSAGLSYHGCGARHTLSHATSSQRSHQRRTIPLFQTHTYYNFLPWHFSRMSAIAKNMLFCLHLRWYISSTRSCFLWIQVFMSEINPQAWDQSLPSIPKDPVCRPNDNNNNIGWDHLSSGDHCPGFFKLHNLLPFQTVTSLVNDQANVIPKQLSLNFASITVHREFLKYKWSFARGREKCCWQIRLSQRWGRSKVPIAKTANKKILLLLEFVTNFKPLYWSDYFIIFFHPDIREIYILLLPYFPFCRILPMKTILGDWSWLS